MKDLNVTIVNAHWNNRGDEAAFMSLLNFLLENGCKKIFVLLKNKGDIYYFPQNERISVINAKFVIYLPEFREYYKNPKSIRDESILLTDNCIKNSDLVIYSPGGSVISDKFFWRKQLEYLFPFACAKRYRKPIFVAAPSFGPYDRGHVLRKMFLSYADLICVREHYSYEYLKKEGISSEIVQTCDLAFSKDIDTETVKKKLFDSELSESKENLLQYLIRFPKSVGVTITDLSWNVRYGEGAQNRRKNVLKTFEVIIDYLNSKGYGVVLIPQLFGNENDENTLKELLSEKSYLLSPKYDNEVQQYVISCLYALIGMRYHSNIFAAKVATPFIPIVYEEKMSGFLDETKLKEYSIPVNELSSNELQKKFELLEKNYVAYRQYLLDMHEIWKSKSNLTKKLLLQKMEEKR